MIQAEGGLGFEKAEGKITQIQWAVELTKVTDQGMDMQGTAAYSCSFEEKQKTFQANFLKLTFRHPMTCGMQYSYFNDFRHKNMTYIIRFISAIGSLKSEYPISQVLSEVQKESSLEMLSMFLQGQFSETFQSIAKEPKVVEKIKAIFNQIGPLLETKQDLIKPIFINLCQENSDLCQWVIEEHLLNPDFQKITMMQVKFLRELIEAQKTSESYLSKVEMVRKYIWEQIETIGAGLEEIREESQQLVLNKLIKVFTKSIQHFEVKFPDKEATIELKLNDLAIQDLVDYKNVQQEIFKENQKMQKMVFKSVLKLFTIFMMPPLSFKNAQIVTCKRIAVLTIQRRVELSNIKQIQIESLKELDLLTVLAAQDNSVFEMMQGKNELQGNVDVVDIIVKTLVRNDNDSKDLINQFCSYLNNLSRAPAFFKIYAQTLPLDLYSKTLKNPLKQMCLNPHLTLESVEFILQAIKLMVMNDQESLEKISTLLKEDLNQPEILKDVSFIKQVIVPLLHAEVPVNMTIRVQDGENTYPITKQFKSENFDFASKQKSTNFLGSSLLDASQKSVFEAKFVEMRQNQIPDSKKMMESEWQLLFKDSQLNQQHAHFWDSPEKFKEMVSALEGQTNIMFLVQTSKTSPNIHQWPVGDNLVFGAYCHDEIKTGVDLADWKQDSDFQIPGNPNDMAFFFKDDQHAMYETGTGNFGVIYTNYSGSGAIGILGEFMLVSYDCEFEHRLGQVDSLTNVENLKFGQATSFQPQIQAFEIWQYQPGKQIKKKGDSDSLRKLFKSKPGYNPTNPLNYFSHDLMFEIGETQSLNFIQEKFLGDAFNVIWPTQLTLKQVAGGSSEAKVMVTKASENDEKKAAQVDKETKPVYPILKKFEESNGIVNLINVAIAVVKAYKDQNQSKTWELWLEELKSFCSLPEFFNYFAKDFEKAQTIYQLIDGHFDITDENAKAQSEKQFLSDYQSVVKYTYSIIQELFKEKMDPTLRELCINNGTFSKLFERLGQLTGEKSRSKKGTIPQEIVLPKQISVSVKKKDEGEKPKTKSKKGVGYTTGIGETWNISEYLASKETRNEQIATIVGIVKESLSGTLSQEMKDILLESSLLPILENALRQCSLLEMAKETMLYDAYLDIISELSSHSDLAFMMLDIGADYVPLQKQSISNLLQKMAEQSQIFLKCLEGQETQKIPMTDIDVKSMSLAKRIVETNTIVDKAVQDIEKQQKKEKLEKFESLPLGEQYKEALQSKRFEYMSMAKNPKTQASKLKWNHYFDNTASSCESPTQAKIVRLAQEVADLSNSLPCDPTNAMFCRVEKTRVDLMKVMIIGAQGTPYANGCFIFDLFFPQDYPNAPPKCQLVTTGGDQVRFNPNLYSNGKVCLSLLGTWRGSSTEMWDPKLSTILQLVLSIQAIIMSNEVYFNEPGYEHEMNTPEGEMKNKGYANIVKYCNIKFGMIDAINNPPEGFREAIFKNFWLKKKQVLEEVEQWIKESEEPATYSGLVWDHNYTWANRFSKPGAFVNAMKEIQAELITTLDQMANPFEEGSKQAAQSEETTQINSKIIEVKQIETEKEQIDVSYDPQLGQQTHKIDIEDEQVKDRWSRYIGAMGIEAVAKQAKSRVLLCELGALGVEVAKNIVLAGCQELVIFEENEKPDVDCDIASGQFFLSKEDVGTASRAQVCKHKLQELNRYVKVTVIPQGTCERVIDHLKCEEKLDKQPFTAIVLTQQLPRDQLIILDSHCRERGIKFIYSFVFGCTASIFNDFGDSFKVLEASSEEVADVLVDKLEPQANDILKVTLIEGQKLNLQDGDTITLQDVKGMVNEKDLTDSINSKEFRVKNIISKSTFVIEVPELEMYSKHEFQGVVKYVNKPKELSFKPIQDFYTKLDEIQPNYDKILDADTLFDPSFIIADFEKMTEIKLMNFLMHKHLSKDEIQQLIKDTTEKDKKEALYGAACRYMTQRQSKVSLPPLNAFMGGLVAQEVVKAMTQKFMPIQQVAIFSFSELVKEAPKEFAGDMTDTYTVTVSDKVQTQSLQDLIGSTIELEKAKVFMIGAGAIGCELLKNFAMLNLGTGKGKITITDPDSIEVSNLNRQFLFREKHLRKPKSLTAAAAAIQMNPKMEGRIVANLDKVHEATTDIYTEDFFVHQDIIMNALDNVQARLFIDKQCVLAGVDMIDSGTLGPKGHIQVVRAFESESYASQKDPEDSTEIPHCTLKMFPEETLHCVEWAKDLFGNWFGLDPQSYNKLLFDSEEVHLNDHQDIQNAIKIIEKHEKRPSTFDDCLEMARKTFQEYFVNNILQLLHVYPKDKQTADGRPFWSLPKRAPEPIDFDPSDAIHSTFVSAYACLMANMFNIENPFSSPRDNDERVKMATLTKSMEFEPFKPSEEKAKDIESEVKKQNENEEEKSSLETMTEETDNEQVQILKVKLTQIRNQMKDQKPLNVEEFEKDQDSNFHVDFIFAMANVRASNYSLPPMDWISVKLKAGKIVPALATTTAAIAGLQTIEMIKSLKDIAITDMRNAFLNLAVPSLLLSEPMAAEKFTLFEGRQVDIWERWSLPHVQPESTLFHTLQGLMFTHLLHKHLAIRDIFCGSIPIFIHALESIQNPEAKELKDFPKMQKTFLGVISEAGLADNNYVDLQIVFVKIDNPNEIVKNTPIVRINFGESDMWDSDSDKPPKMPHFDQWV